MNRLTRPFLFFPLLAFAAAAHAQSLEAFQGLYAQDASGDFVGTDGNGSANDASDPFTVSRDFTGMDGNGVTQTMNVTGSAYSSSTYGALHLFGAGTVTNSYYNAANPSVINGDGSFNPDGSPELIGLHGNAGWSDSITYTGFQGTGYKVDYYYRLEGTTSGDTEAGLNFSSNGGYYGPRTTRGNELWVTPDFDVAWGVPSDFSVDMYAGLSTHLSQHTDGSTISGYADYSDTLILEGAVIKDPNGNVVNGWSVATASGVSYIKPLPTPEPASLAAVGVGTLALIRRRRKMS